MYTAILVRTGFILADRVSVATDAATAPGLLGRDGMEPGEGLHLTSTPFGCDRF